MYWEMDQSGHERDLKCISDYLLSFFAFAAGTASTSFVKTEWLAFAGADGKWLYELYEKDAANGAAMRQAIRQLFRLPASERQNIYRAIAHDMTFEQSRTAAFEFQSIEPHLKGEQCKIIKDFFLYFYEVALCSAHIQLSGLSRHSLNRKELTKIFFAGKNRNLLQNCPICLQTVTNSEREGDAEHYFGKAAVPCLALHPYNLYFSCKSCNQVYKGSKSPLKSGPDLRKVFLPYLDVVKQKTKLEFYHEEKQDGLRIRPANVTGPYIVEKIEAFDQLFKLEERWSGMLERYYLALRKDYEGESFVTTDDLKALMRADIKRAKRRCSVRPEQYLETKYQEWISDRQLKAFYSELKHRGRKAVTDMEA